jgi:hypothetical protein
MARFPCANADHNRNVKTPHNEIHTQVMLIETPHASICQHATLFHFAVYLYGILQDGGPHPYHYN